MRLMELLRLSSCHTQTHEHAGISRTAFETATAYTACKNTGKQTFRDEKHI
jgi:hypothetical protein